MVAFLRYHSVRRRNGNREISAAALRIGRRPSHAQIAVPEAATGSEAAGGAAPGGAAALDDGVAIGEPHEALDVLVEHEDGLPGRAQTLQALPDLLAHEWREALGGFVQDEEIGVGDERAADGQHLQL